MASEDDCRNLMQKAYECLDAYDAKAAAKLGERLLKLQYSGGYEILALAYQQEGKNKKAIAALKDGLKKAPQVFALWQLLGSLYSDEEDFGAAFAAYEKALSCPAADVGAIRLNRAIVYYRQKNSAQGLIELDAIEQLPTVERKLTEPFYLQCSSLRASLLNQGKKFEEAISFTQPLITALENIEDLDLLPTGELAKFHVELAQAYLRGRQDRELSLRHVREALFYERTQPFAMQLLRELIGKRSPSARHFWLQLCGQWHCVLESEDYRPGFFVNYEVVADSKEEALAFASDFEPVEVRGSLQIQEFKEMEPCPDALKGVYHTSGHLFFKPDDD